MVFHFSPLPVREGSREEREYVTAIDLDCKRTREQEVQRREL